LVKITTSRRIAAPAEDIWRLLEDFGNFYRVNPLLECSPVVNGVARGIGAERECQFYDGSTIRERITAVRAGESMEIAITGSSLPIREGRVMISVAPEDPGHARVTFNATITLKFGVLGRVLGLVMRLVLKSQFNLVLRGIATHLATGEVVGPRSALLAV
jgi:carbon monoxide dehydrogenase subunit G